MIRLFTGYDEREAIGFHVFVASVLARASEPVSIVPITKQVMGQRDGSNTFSYSRFLVPYLCGFKGMAIFADGCDMLCLGDIAELADLYDPYMAVQVVRHDYKTRHQIKYVGTSMESRNVDYPRKNWSSLMVINCGHYAWRPITPQYVQRHDGPYMHGFQFLQDRFIGELPDRWNWLVDEFDENAHANLLHWTAGIPAFEAYRDAPMAAEWFAERAERF